LTRHSPRNLSSRIFFRSAWASGKFPRPQKNSLPPHLAVISEESWTCYCDYLIGRPCDWGPRVREWLATYPLWIQYSVLRAWHSAPSKVYPIDLNRNRRKGSATLSNLIVRFRWPRLGLNYRSECNKNHKKLKVPLQIVVYIYSFFFGFEWNWIHWTVRGERR